MQGNIEISPFFSCDSEMSKLWNSETYWNSISIQVYEREYRNTGKTCRASTKTIWSSWVQKPCNLYSRGNMTEHLLLTYLTFKIGCRKTILHWILICTFQLRMAKNPEKVKSFYESLIPKLQPIWKTEKEELLKLKEQEVRVCVIVIWIWPFEI